MGILASFYNHSEGPDSSKAFFKEDTHITLLEISALCRPLVHLMELRYNLSHEPPPEFVHHILNMEPSFCQSLGSGIAVSSWGQPGVRFLAEEVGRGEWAQIIGVTSRVAQRPTVEEALTDGQSCQELLLAQGSRSGQDDIQCSLHASHQAFKEASLVRRQRSVELPVDVGIKMRKPVVIGVKRLEEDRHYVGGTPEIASIVAHDDLWPLSPRQES